MPFKLVDPDYLARWQFEIDRIGESVNHPTLFDDVQQACLNRRAFLFASHEAFFVVAPSPDKLLGWIGVNTSARTKHQDGFPFFEQLGRDIGVPALEVWSRRRGFARTLPKLGYTGYAATWHGTPMIVWRKPLEYDHV